MNESQNLYSRYVEIINSLVSIRNTIDGILSTDELAFNVSDTPNKDQLCPSRSEEVYELIESIINIRQGFSGINNNCSIISNTLTEIENIIEGE